MLLNTTHSYVGDLVYFSWCICILTWDKFLSQRNSTSNGSTSEPSEVRDYSQANIGRDQKSLQACLDTSISEAEPGPLGEVGLGLSCSKLYVKNDEGREHRWGGRASSLTGMGGGEPLRRLPTQGNIWANTEKMVDSGDCHSHCHQLAAHGLKQ